MAPADDALKLNENAKTQKNFSSDTNLSDIVGDLSQSNKSLDMIPEKSQNVIVTVSGSSSDNNNFIEAKNVACNKNFSMLQQQQTTTTTVNVNSANEIGSSSKETTRHDVAKNNNNKNEKLAKDIDELVKIYHEDHNELIKGNECTTTITTTATATTTATKNISINNNDNIINSNVINNVDNDAGEDADDEDEFERVFENSMQNLEKNLDNYESSSSENSDCEYCDKEPSSLQYNEKSNNNNIITTTSTTVNYNNTDYNNKYKSGNYIKNMISNLPSINQSGGLTIETPPIKINKSNTLYRTRAEKLKENELKKSNNNNNDGSDISDSDEDCPNKIIDEIARSPKLLPTEMLNNHKMFLFRPFSLPFQERRRLSQCKEEDENEDSDNNKISSQKSDPTCNDTNNLIQNTRRERYSYKHLRSPPVPESQLMSEKFKELERLRDQFRRKLEEIHPSTIDIETESLESDNNNIINNNMGTNLISTNNNPKVYKGKFVVTKAEDPSSSSSQILNNQSNTINNNNNNSNNNNKNGIKIQKDVPKLRSEAVKLRSLQPQMNSFTIHFPNSKGISGHTRLQNLFGPKTDNNDTTNINNHNINNNDNELKRHTVSFQPHLDKQFFDTSLVEIRPISDSTKSLDDFDNTKKNTDDFHNIWIPRASNSVTPASSRTSVDDQDGSKSAGSSRPSSAPAEPNAKAARKASKKMEKEARRQEKELRNKEKEARKRLEREQAKLEKLNRNSEKIARSTERLAPRSGSLERRRSGEDSPVLNQSTVHGIASPNRRPTIFDVFRPRTKSDAKRKDKDAALHSGSEKDNSSTSSNHSGSGGIMKAMKHVVQNTVGHHRHHQQSSEKPSVKYRDGSAHPHAGSDAQYYHTVTAVRRADASRSPMTKVMDLFRYRSNSAVNEADKRKARAAAHQQLLAAQIVHDIFIRAVLRDFEKKSDLILEYCCGR